MCCVSCFTGIQPRPYPQHHQERTVKEEQWRSHTDSRHDWSGSRSSWRPGKVKPDQINILHFRFADGFIQIILSRFLFYKVSAPMILFFFVFPPHTFNCLSLGLLFRNEDLVIYHNYNHASTIANINESNYCHSINSVVIVFIIFCLSFARKYK